ncbi:RusA family crossover junction endodeoxyribonuclease [Metasolibacillus meyeri]|uniref:RusA family crossover junction endodeoxyribonuclease n=1 Tax=Metasolibacillus meyeri TaxID=1071052 RepID=UPI000D3145EE|nr:RusA family crossover junction endodeoxyribonuclease [Metasolibacillus meyeri]
MIQFVIPGKVQAQERPRFSRAGKGVRTHDAPKSKNYKEWVSIIAMQNKPQEPLQGALRLEVDIYVMPPKKYHTKPKQALIARGELRPVTKPDIENLLKGIMDGMTGIIYRDDAQIVELVARKWYSMEPRAEIKVQQII